MLRKLHVRFGGGLGEKAKRTSPACLPYSYVAAALGRGSPRALGAQREIPPKKEVRYYA
jgi:hypothetical protein